MLCLALYFGVSLTVDLHRTAEDFFRLSGLKVVDPPHDYALI